MYPSEQETYQIYSNEWSIISDPRYEGTNASRFAILSALATSGQTSFGTESFIISPETLERFGFDSRIDRYLSERGNPYTELEEATDFIRNAQSWLGSESRQEAWARIASGDVRSRLTLLADGLRSSLERESAVAAVAILRIHQGGEPGIPRSSFRDWLVERVLARGEAPWWQHRYISEVTTSAWDGSGWQSFATEQIASTLESRHPMRLLQAIRQIAAIRVLDAAQSSDSIVRDIAATLQWSHSHDAPRESTTSADSKPPNAPKMPSTMIHGTFAWKGKWWYPRGNFHTYVKNSIRPELYSGGMEFSWSGAYTQNQRAIAGDRFARWVRGCAPVGGLDTVFAHSYGGEIAARAINNGAKVDELVLLSAPINQHHIAALDRVARVVDVRLELDIVLTLAREKQKLPSHSKVTEFVVHKAFWNHGVTHDPKFWYAEQVAKKCHL